ncbi:hypothetical protein M0805_007012 [Coniferiporia weirii]|nr:hypothetical protein M0805_007012 [Coniferiporia weirii]
MESPSHSKVHPMSQAGFGVGKSELYDKVRPSYASEVLSHIRKAVKGKDGLKIVEVGCGSGIFTRALLAHPEWSSSISELRCIDPNEGMRAVFAKTMKDARVSLFDGTFDNTGAPDGWADLIVSASAFHWCSDLGGALSEFVRILKPEGTISFTWNYQNNNTAEWITQIFALCAPYQESTASNREHFKDWRRMFDLSLYKESFSEPEDTMISSTEPSTLEKTTLLVFTRSGVAILPDDEKLKIREEIKSIVERGDGLVWLDEKEGIFEVPFSNPVVVMQRKFTQ